jgi:hypothetical protein
MNPEWLPASEAAKILETRGVDPIEALATIVRQTGEHGLNRYWALANRVVIRARSGTLWLSEPDIDLAAGTISVPSYAAGRRMPGMLAVPLLLASDELDRRWPDSFDPQRQKTTATQRQEQEAARYFLETVVPRGRCKKETVLDELRTKFPALSERHFKQEIWGKHAPPAWKKAGAPVNR